MGPGVLRASARHVRDRAVDGIAPAGWCWRATAWASSRCTWRGAAAICTSRSELKAIFVHPEVERQFRPGGARLLPVAELRAGPVHHGGGHREAASGLLAGVAGRADAVGAVTGGCRARRAPERRRLELEAATSELDSLLQQSVREHLLSDVPLGIWLSGGLDSSTLLHYAAAASTSRLKTFSISFAGPELRRSGARSAAWRPGTAPTTKSST